VKGHQRIADMDRHTVNHGRGEYVRGDAYTNTAEGFISLLKRGIVGTFHHVGKAHLGKYVSEFEFRYNARKVADKDRPALIVCRRSLDHLNRHAIRRASSAFLIASPSRVLALRGDRDLLPMSRDFTKEE
jgi:hypothetical protein